MSGYETDVWNPSQYAFLSVMCLKHFTLEREFWPLALHNASHHISSVFQNSEQFNLKKKIETG